MIENIKARVFCKPFDIYKEDITSNSNGYYIYNGVIYYGCRFFVFIVSAQNSWYQQQN
jgi:hypothetical protein